MKTTYQSKPKPRLGEARTLEKFAWFPTEIDSAELKGNLARRYKTMIFLESYFQEEVYLYRGTLLGYQWVVRRRYQ